MLNICQIIFINKGIHGLSPSKFQGKQLYNCNLQPHTRRVFPSMCQVPSQRSNPTFRLNFSISQMFRRECLMTAIVWCAFFPMILFLQGEAGAAQLIHTEPLLTRLFYPSFSIYSPPIYPCVSHTFGCLRSKHPLSPQR